MWRFCLECILDTGLGRCHSELSESDVQGCQAESNSPRNSMGGCAGAFQMLFLILTGPPEPLFVQQPGSFLQCEWKPSSPSTSFSVLLPPKCKLRTQWFTKPLHVGALPPHSATHLIPSFLPQPMLSGHKHLLTLPRTFRAPSHPRGFARDGLHYMGCSFPVLPEQVFQTSGLSFSIISEQCPLTSPLVTRYYNSLPVSFITFNTVFFFNAIGCNLFKLIIDSLIPYLSPPVECMFQKANCLFCSSPNPSNPVQNLPCWEHSNTVKMNKWMWMQF